MIYVNEDCTNKGERRNFLLICKIEIRIRIMNNVYIALVHISVKVFLDKHWRFVEFQLRFKTNHRSETSTIFASSNRVIFYRGTLLSCKTRHNFRILLLFPPPPPLPSSLSIFSSFSPFRVRARICGACLVINNFLTI